MSKHISITAAIAALLSALALCLLASCTPDDGLTNPTDGLVSVTITANIDPQMTTRANGTDSELPTRCYVEVHNLDGEQVFFDEMTPENGKFTANALLGDGAKYNFYFWADNAKGAAAPTSLGNIAYTENTVAYSGMVQEGEWSANGISCTLKHCVAKLTLRTTADVPAGRNTIMQIGGGCFGSFNLLEGMVNDGKTAGSVTGYGDIFQISTNSPFSAGDDVLTCYVLAATKTEEEAMNDEDYEHGNCDYTVFLWQDIPEYELYPRKATEVARVPIKPNQHTIIKGDVSKVSHSDFTYTVTTESLGGAGYDETWGSTIPDLPFEKLDLTKGAITITDDGTYHITSNGTTTTNAITVSGNISPKIYISDLNMAVSSGSAISITGGASATIHVLGENSLENAEKSTTWSYGGAGIYVASGSNVSITGNSRSDVLTVTGNKGGSGIGGYIDNNFNSISCGNIVIDNITVYAYSKRCSEMGDFAPGIGGAGKGGCGSISIRNATVHAYGVFLFHTVTPGIGSGISATGPSATRTVPIVTIDGSEVHSHRGANGKEAYDADYIGYGNNQYKTGYSSNAINLGGGKCASSTIYCYTGNDDTADKVVVYDSSGNGTEQSQ